MLAWKHGAQYFSNSGHTSFRVWAPLATRVNLQVERVAATGDSPLPVESVTMKMDAEGYWHADLEQCGPGSRYSYAVDDHAARPDPASRHQPDGVHSPSAVVDAAHRWTDSAWTGLPLEEYVIYEFHVGALTDKGTFDAAVQELPRLKALGITAVEIMPIAQCPGRRNWGYDGVYLYSAAEEYGGLGGLQRFVDAAHALGLAVILDVVYNHLGPEGNYLSCFGPYFTDNYHTPWGAGVNFDAPYSDGVRDFFTGNALFWMEVCHIDALRLDAVHAIIDSSAYPFLRQLVDSIHALGRRLHRRLFVIGENDRNDPAFTSPKALGGMGADSQWSDDFHHALHAVLTRENHGYYEDFGRVSQLAKAYTDGFVFDGCYSPHRKRHHGADSRAQEGIRFVACTQNHDQVGNRPDGTRLSALLEFSRLKLAAVALMTAPYIPLVFMGEESAAVSPFLYFVDHGDPTLIQGVRDGRAKEFREFFKLGTPVDPQSEEAFLASKLRPDTSEKGVAMQHLYADLLRLRREIPALATMNKRHTDTVANDRDETLVVKRREGSSQVTAFFNFSDEPRQLTCPATAGPWRTILHSSATRYGGTLAETSQVFPSTEELSLHLPPCACILLLHQPKLQ